MKAVGNRVKQGNVHGGSRKYLGRFISKRYFGLQISSESSQVTIYQANKAKNVKQKLGTFYF